MEKEKIELAAQETAYRHFGCKSCNTNNPAFSCEDYCGIDTFIDGFSNGARWRINAVWHKPSAYGKELKRDVEVIAKTKRGYRFGKFDVLGCLHEYIAFVSPSSIEYALSDVLEYAYLDDLLPDTRKEAEP